MTTFIKARQVVVHCVVNSKSTREVVFSAFRREAILLT